MLKVYLRNTRENLLFWKILAVFLLMLAVLAFVYLTITSKTSAEYYNRANQQLYGNIASHLAHTTRPLKNGKPDTAVTHDIIHSIMVVNPVVEVYLLDTTGRIIDYVVPDKSVKRERVSLAKVQQFIKEGGHNYISGDNPKDPEAESIFSAAPVKENGKVTGYIYAVLASEKQKEIFAALSENYYHRLGVKVFFVTLIIAFVIGSAVLFLITDSVTKIARVVRRFKEGDYTARIDGKAKGNLGILSSTFNEMADEIVANIEKISGTDKLRQELVANVSHDLRTPLAIMQGYIETLIIKKNDISAAEKERYLGIILDSSKKLAKLVDQLFQYSKLEANEVQPEKEQFLLNELLSDILIKYQLIAQKKDINLQLQAPDNLQPVFADLALTERVLQNLLDNAMKFTPGGGSIIVRLENRPQGVEITVTDTGVGIERADQPYIFERFNQVSKTGFSSKGMGLGLTIVKKILDLHHVTINMESMLGKGTTFWFELPVAAKHV